MSLIPEFDGYREQLNAVRMEVSGYPDSEIRTRLMAAIDGWNQDYYDQRSNLVLDTIVPLMDRYQRILAMMFHLKYCGQTQSILPTGQ